MPKEICDLKAANYVLTFLQPGNYTHIDGGNVRIEIATYYNYLPKTVSLEKPVVSVPYMDAFGTGNYWFFFHAIEDSVNKNSRELKPLLFCRPLKGQPLTDSPFDHLFLLWKFALLIVAI